MNEVFKKKYLKYSPEITLEIFTLVWNRLIELGYKHYCNFPIDEAYNEFKGDYEYFRTTEEHPNEFNCYHNEDIYKKITVEEILGYDPFTKNDFILPERWCIKTEKNTKYELIGKWFDSQSSNHCYKSSCLGEYYHSHNYSNENILNKSRMGASFAYTQRLIGFTEITFEQFKKYVLKETVIPENIKTGKDWSKATEEELLEEAKRRYPIGCKVELIRGNSGGDFGSEVRFTKHKFYDTSKGKQLFVDCNLLLFYETWVEIESLPEAEIESRDWSKASEEELLEEAKRRYPIGCKFKSFTDNGMIREVIPYNVKKDNTITFLIRHGDVQFNNGISTKDSGCSNPYVFKNGNWAEIISLPETKVESKEVIPEYVECISWTGNSFTTSKIYKVVNGKVKDNDGDHEITNWDHNCFKPSSKSAFDAQNKPKSIEKWSVGSYVVCIERYTERFKVGDIGIIEGSYGSDGIDISKSVRHSCIPRKTNCKWFATKSEAAEFAETLKSKKLLSLNQWYESGNYIVYLYERNKVYGFHHDKWFTSEGFNESDLKYTSSYIVENKFTNYIKDNYSIGKSFIDLVNKLDFQIKNYSLNFNNNTTQIYISVEPNKVKDNKTARIFDKGVWAEYSSIKSNKQAVHCKTQEEWDFVKNKINRTNTWEEDYPCQILVGKTNWKGAVQFCIDEGCQILSFQEWCDLNGYKMETKQQAVRCTTQEEWDFITEKLGYKWAEYSTWDCYKNNTCINLGVRGFGTADVAYKKYQILSFQEWCNLNGYKMEKEVKFEVGKWYSMKTAYSWIIKYKGTIDGRIKADWYCENKSGKKVKKDGNWSNEPTEVKELSLEEIQQYLPDGHPDKIKSDGFKVGDWVVITKSSRNWTPEMNTEVGKIVQITHISDTLYINYEEKPCWSFGARDGHFRHATLEEINNHLISIGQIPAGEPLNNGVKPNKDGIYQITVDEPLNNYVIDKKKYSIKELETNSKLLIYINSKEEHDRIRKVSKRICSYYGKYCYSLYDKTYSSRSSKSCLGSYDGDSILLTINDIIFEDSIKNDDKEIPSESYIGKYISFSYHGQFYDKAFITEENVCIYVLNNCHSNNDGHKDKSKYKYSLKFTSIERMFKYCEDIKFLDFESPKFKPLHPDDLTWEIAENPNKIEFNYLPEPK